jgi:hypothetical protein
MKFFVRFGVKIGRTSRPRLCAACLKALCVSLLFHEPVCFISAFVISLLLAAFYNDDTNRIPGYKSWSPTGSVGRALVRLSWFDRTEVARVFYQVARAYDWPCHVAAGDHCVFRYFSSYEFEGALAHGVPEWLIAPENELLTKYQMYRIMPEKLAGLCCGVDLRAHPPLSESVIY